MKRNVRIFSMILALLCVISMIPLMTVSATESAETTEPAKYVDLSTYADGANYTPDEGVTNYTVVKTYETLRANDRVMNANYILGSDIDCSSGWNTINLNGHILDGNGYAIYGISVSSTSAGVYLFSGVSTEKNVMKNLTVGLPGNEVKMTTSAANKVSGLVGDVKNNETFTFQNVTVYAKFNTTRNLSGAFVGLLRKGTLNFTDCRVYGSIDNDAVGGGSNPAGGFIGGVQDRSGACTVNMTNCVNYATVSGAGNSGGFIGMVQSGYTSGTEHNVTVTIKNCVNAGNISICNVADRRGVGGIVGLQNGVNPSSPEQSKSVLSIENCLNTGSIKGEGDSKDAWAAGLVGFVAQQNLSTSYKNSANVGKIHAEGNAYASGLSGRATAITLENCGFFGTVTSTQSGRFGMVFANVGWGPKSAQSLYYTKIDGSADLSGSKPITGDKYKNVEAKDLETGIKWINSLLDSTLGKVIMNKDCNGAVLATPTFAGVQESVTTDGKIRLVATINDSLNYSEVGFKVELVGGQSLTVDTHQVFDTLTCTNEEGFDTSISASELYGKYIFALSIYDIDTDAVLKVTPYGKDLEDPTIEYVGDSYEIVYTQGKVVDVRLGA